MDEIKELDSISANNLSSLSPRTPSSPITRQQEEQQSSSPCPPVAINSVVINGGDSHIGDTHKTITKTENLILNVTSLEDDFNSAEAQIIKSIQTNLEGELSDLKAYDKHVALISKVVVSASVLIIIFATVFAVCVTNQQPRNTNLVNIHLPENASYCDGICFVSREEWGLKWVPTKGSCARLKEANKLRVNLLFSVCVSIEQCSKVFRGAQDRLNYYNLTTANKNTLKKNFIIGGDERYYVGRGWFCGWEKYLSIAMTFNNYTFAISERQTYLFQLLIHTGRRCGFVNRGFDFKFECGLYCYAYNDFERIVNMTKQDLFLVRDYETFLQDSKTVSESACENSDYSCKIKDRGADSKDVVECSFP